jgi:hypothetical protein
MITIWFAYQIDNEPTFYQAKVVTDMNLPTHGEFIFDYLLSITSYGMGKYRKQEGLPPMKTGIQISRLSHSKQTNELTPNDRLNYDFCFSSENNKSSYYIHGIPVLLN